MLEKNEKGHVVATCRNPGKATGLLELKDKFSERLCILELDVTNESTIKVSLFSFNVVFTPWLGRRTKDPL